MKCIPNSNARKHPTHFICVVCKHSFPNIHSDKERRFCSRTCYWRSDYIVRNSKALQSTRIATGTHNLYRGVCKEEYLERERARQSLAYRLWREAVFKRDDYTCQNCGVRGGILQADHIKSFAFHPTQRFQVSNGRTLCRGCHRQTPNYGYKARLLHDSQICELHLYRDSDKARPRIEIAVH
jgi:5-methylcytosine-specific restriction endonuclease McrA